MKILVIKTSSLGDILHAFDVLSYLKKKRPDCEIDWVVESRCKELVQAHPLIEKTWVIDSKKWKGALFNRETWKEILAFRSKISRSKYDVVFDLQGNIKSSIVLAFVCAVKKVGFGWKTVPEWPNTLFTNVRINPPSGKNIREDYLAVVKGFFGDDNFFEKEPILLKLTVSQEKELENLQMQALQSTVLVSFGSNWINKRLSEDRLVEVLKNVSLSTRSSFLFIWGSKEEKRVGIRLASHFSDSLVLNLSIPVLQHVMARCRLVVAMDSFPLHLCATTSTPTLSFFGPSSSKKYCPLGKQHTTIQGECPYGIAFDKRCPQLRSCKTGECLKGGLATKKISQCSLPRDR